jgi:hypothetical protein
MRQNNQNSRENEMRGAEIQNGRTRKGLEAPAQWNLMYDWWRHASEKTHWLQSHGALSSGFLGWPQF